MSTLEGAKTPNIPGIGLSRILESAKEFVSFLAPPGLAVSPPWPAATTNCPELVLRDVKKPSQKFKRLQIPTAELRVVLRAYRDRLDELRIRARQEYGIICGNQPHAMQLQILSTFSDYWVQARDDLLERTVEAAAEVAKLAPPGKPRMFNKEFVPMFEYVFGQVESGRIRRRDKRFLATLSDMEYRQITVWFQNRRARTKKKIQNGQYTQPPPTLEETTAKLRALIEKEDTKSSNQKQVVMTTERTFVVKLEFEEEEEEDEEEMTVEYSSLDLYNERLSMMFEGDDPPSLDYWAPSPGSFPDPFNMPAYEVPSFPPPRWPRAPQLWLPHRVPVGDEDVAEITRKLEKVELAPPTVIEAPVTLTQTMNAATAARCTLVNKVLNSIRSFVPMPRRPKLKVVKNKKDKKNKKTVAPHYVLHVASSQDEPNTAQNNVQTGMAQIPNEPGVPNTQVQVSGNEDPPVLQGNQSRQDSPALHDAQLLPPSQAPYDLPALVAHTIQPPISYTDQQPAIAQNLPAAPAHNVQVPIVQSALQVPTAQNPPATQGPQNPPAIDNSQQASTAQIPPVTQGPQASNGTPDADPDPTGLCDKVSQMEIDVEKSKRQFKHRLATYDKLFVEFYPDEIEEGCDVVTDELGRPIQPYPNDHPLPRLDIPPDDFMDHATMMEVLRMTLKELNYQGPMPSDDPIEYSYGPNFTDDSVNEHLTAVLKPYYTMQEDETIAAMDTAFTGNRQDFQFEPVDLPQPTPVPAPIADPFPRSFYLDEPSREINVDNSAVPFDQFYDSEGVPLPLALNTPALQMFNNDDTIAAPTYDPLYDPQGAGIPFTLYDELSAPRPQNQLDEDDFLDTPFPDSYMFLDMSTRGAALAPERHAPMFEPEPEPQPPAEPEMSIYPSYLPQVPLVTNEFKKAATFLHSWLDRVTGIKLTTPPFIDPEEMLQYLA